MFLFWIKLINVLQKNNASLASLIFIIFIYLFIRQSILGYLFFRSYHFILGIGEYHHLPFLRGISVSFMTSLTASFPFKCTGLEDSVILVIVLESVLKSKDERVKKSQ